MALSEAGADHRNRALAHVLAEHGRLLNDVDDVLAHYYAQCAITGSAPEIARALASSPTVAGTNACSTRPTSDG